MGAGLGDPAAWQITFDKQLKGGPTGSPESRRSLAR